MREIWRKIKQGERSYKVEEKIFRYLVKHCVSASSTSFLPLSARFIAKQLKTTYKECIKCLHILKDKGLVEVVRGGYYSDYYGKNFLYCGWYITSKAQETETYKEEDERVCESIEREVRKYRGQQNDNT